MHPELKYYLENYHVRTMACYHAMDKKLQLQDALFKFIMGASTPQSTHSVVMASDGCLIVDATVVAVIPDAPLPPPRPSG